MTETKIKERALSMTAPEVRALLAGKKSQMRRIVALKQFGPSTTPGYDWHFRNRRELWNDIRNNRIAEFCPYGQPGNQLWAQETWKPIDFEGPSTLIRYRIDDSEVWQEGRVRYKQHDDINWRSPTHMRRWMSRFTLEVTGVRVQRLNEIDADEAIAEGISTTKFWLPKEVDENPKPVHEWKEPYWDDYYFWTHYPQVAYRNFWQSMDMKEGFCWHDNPWMWVVEFKVVKK